MLIEKYPLHLVEIVVLGFAKEENIEKKVKILPVVEAILSSFINSNNKVSTSELSYRNMIVTKYDEEVTKFSDQIERKIKEMENMSVEMKIEGRGPTPFLDLVKKTLPKN